MKSRSIIYLWLLPVILCVFLFVRYAADRENPSQPPATIQKRSHRGAPATSGLANSFAQITGKPETSKDSLAQLAKRLASLPKDQAIAGIEDFIHSGRDKDTGLPYEIGPEGNLTGWPTFRVYLLDLISKIDSVAAAAISQEILATPTTADEWSLALRNLGRQDRTPESDKFLSGKAVELIANPNWQTNPSVGFLNSFDILVHTEATAQTPLLSSLIQRKDRKDLAHAGFLTIDRLVQRQPVDMLNLLAADNALLQSRPEMTAQEFARADLRDLQQREIVKSWLLDPARTPAELRSFAGVYPNNNRFVSNNLLTTDTRPTGSDLATHDRAALEILQSWTTDPAFLSVNPQLHSMIARLNGFLGKPQSPPVQVAPTQ